MCGIDWLSALILPIILPLLDSGCASFFSCLCGKVGNIWHLGENLELLNRALEELKAERDDVVTEVEAEELKGGRRLAKVTTWLSQVQAIETNSKELIDDVSVQQGLLTSESRSTDNIPTRLLGEKVFTKLNEVRDLSSRGKTFDVVIGQAPLSVVENKNVDQTFGLDATVVKAWESVKKNKNVGIYGMGGVGKSTLLTLISNKFYEVKNDYDVVIWVEVSKVADVENIQDENRKMQVVINKIQDKIAKRLHIHDESWCTYSKTKKAGEIGRVLKDKLPRFVLLLDDLWEEVSLSEIGIPLLGKEYKVVFTTRSKEVCGSMGAKEDIKVECLAENDALDLFKLKARCSKANDEILGIAKEIAAKCCGLPLALQVIGKTLASKTSVREWRRALENLESTSSELRGTLMGIFEVLKSSYNNLEKNDAKLCFQYCALFPKAYNIKRDELVEYWIGEGIIGKTFGRRRAKRLGDKIIDTLIEAGLLLKDGESEQNVYMHDMIREMALWIVSTLEDGEKYFVQAGAGLSKLPYVTNWRTVTKMSLMNNQIKSIPDNPEFLNPDRLVTLFLQNNKLVDIVGRFFQVLSTLVVLDLSGNHDITRLPDVSKLVSLRYLSLLGTKIKKLPNGLEKLNQLIHLDLDSTTNLQSISLISGLLELQVLRFYGSKASLDVSLLEHLQSLKHLVLLTITVRQVGVLKAFLGSSLAGRTQGLYLEGVRVLVTSFAATFGALGSLRNLKMINCDIIESGKHGKGKRKCQYSPSTSSNQISSSNTWFKNLSAVVLLSCEHLKDLTWLIYCKNLEYLSITLSPKMEQVISKVKAGDVGVEPFLKLQVLDLDYLDKLKGIYWKSLSFPGLNKVHITDCPNLSLDSMSERKIDDLLISRN